VNQGGNNKLRPKYFGPFQVVDKVGQVAYKLNLPLEAQIHPVIHVSELKSFVGELPEHPHIPEWLRGTRVDVVLKPHKILARKMVRRQNSVVVQYLVHWADQDESQATWGFADDFERKYPNFVV